MTTIKLTEARWLAREVERARGVLLSNLQKGGLDQSELLQLLKAKGVGSDWTSDDFIIIRDILVAEGTIKIE